MDIVLNLVEDSNAGDVSLLLVSVASTLTLVSCCSVASQSAQRPLPTLTCRLSVFDGIHNT